jgi:hypothetical protein
MSYEFFKQPILDSPYDYPNKHCELDQPGQSMFEVVNDFHSVRCTLFFSSSARTCIKS